MAKAEELPVVSKAWVVQTLLHGEQREFLNCPEYNPMEKRPNVNITILKLLKKLKWGSKFNSVLIKSCYGRLWIKAVASNFTSAFKL